MKRREFIGLILGTVGAWPRSVVAQQSMPVIGFLNSSPSGRDNPLFAPFLAGLREVGYVEGQNVVIEYLSAWLIKARIGSRSLWIKYRPAPNIAEKIMAGQNSPLAPQLNNWPKVAICRE